MDVVGDQHHGLAFAEDLLAFLFRELAPLKIQSALQRLVMIQIAQRRWCGDLQHHERISVGGGTQVAVTHAVAGGGQFLKVLDNLVVADDLAVGADAESEVLLGGWNGLRRRDGGQEHETGEYSPHVKTIPRLGPWDRGPNRLNLAD